MPQYLQAATMQKAFDSCDNEYIDELASMFDSFPLSFSNGDVVEVSGEWRYLCQQNCLRSTDTHFQMKRCRILSSTPNSFNSQRDCEINIICLKPKT
jgi:hypothetical protein